MANLDQELTEEEMNFAGECWDGVHESGKIGITGLTTLCETLSIPMDALNQAVEGLGDEDCTMDRDEFMVLMGRFSRSGVLTLPQMPVTDEATDSFIGECWEGIQESGKLNMAGLNTLCETLNITMEDVMKAVDGLGTEDCTLVFHEFVVMMKRLLDSKAVVLPPLTSADKSTNETEKEEFELSEVELDYVAKCWDGVQESGRVGMTSFNTLCETLNINMEDASNAVEGLGDEAGKMDHDEFVTFMGRLLQCGALTVPPNERQAGKEDGVGDGGDCPNLMAAMNVELNEVAVPAAPASAGAWMTSLAGNEEESDESDTEVTQPVATSSQAAAWMNTIGYIDDDEEDDIAETDVNRVKGSTTSWMNAMAHSDDEPDEDHDKDHNENVDGLLDFSFKVKKPVTPEPMEAAKEFVEEDAEDDFDQLIDINFMGNKKAAKLEVADAPPVGVVNWMDMMLAPADSEDE